MKSSFPVVIRLCLCLVLSILVACGGGHGGGGSGGNGNGNGNGSGNTNPPPPPPPPLPYEPTLYQAIYGGGSYSYTGQFYITGAPDDTDWNRWGMLHDGSTYRLYFMKEGATDTLYQFAYNASSADYEYGSNSITPIKLTNIPADADTSSFAMSNSKTGVSGSYYAHMKSKTNDALIYTFRFNGSVYAYERSYKITKAPADTDWSRWAMLYGQSASRFYAGKTGDDSVIYQFKYNPTTQSYEWGYNGAVGTIAVSNMPTDSETADFSMLNNGSQYQFYYLNKQN